MYTPSQVSEMLDIPSSTLRRYASDFAEHLSEQARQKGRQRRYNEPDLVILARARKLLNAGHKPEQVNSMLFVVEDNELEHEENSSLALIPGISQAIEQVNNQAAEMAMILKELAERQHDTEQAQTALYERQAESESTQAAMLERLAELEKQAGRSWLDKLLGR